VPKMTLHSLLDKVVYYVNNYVGLQVLFVGHYLSFTYTRGLAFCAPRAMWPAATLFLTAVSVQSITNIYSAGKLACC
jgi:hypothetical protein